MPTYQVISLQSISDGQGGWEVNDAHYTGQEVELPENAKLPDIMAALKGVGLMYKHIKAKQVYLQTETGDSFYVMSKEGRHLWELRPTAVEASGNETREGQNEEA